MHDLVIAVVAFLMGELQVMLYLRRANIERDAFLKAFDKHLQLFQRHHHIVRGKLNAQLPIHESK